MPVIYYAAYELGAFFLDTPVKAIEFEISWSWITQSLGAIWQPFLLGCLAIGLVSAALGYLTINILWRCGWSSLGGNVPLTVNPQNSERTSLLISERLSNRYTHGTPGRYDSRY
jgi:hypothetical protein